VDRSVTFSQLRANPDQYHGQIVMFSGIVLDAKRKRDQSEIEVLELPGQPGAPPTGDRTQSEGRFLAVKEGLDPAVVEKEHPITVIGRVTGKAVKLLDETEYTYPVLEVLHMTDWAKMQPRYARGGYGYPYRYPYYGGYYGGFWGAPFGFSPYYYGPYYGPWGYYSYPFFAPGTIAPPSPPPQQAPPRFHKKD
jgi:outer membrane lipoprotein